MKKLNIISKIFLFLSLLFGALWFGSYLTRLLVTYQLFEPIDFAFKPYVNQNNISGILTTMNPAVWLTMISYIPFIIFFILFLVVAKPEMKKNGWLFLSALAVFLTAPFEIYLLTIDYKIVIEVNSGVFNSQRIIGFIIERFKVLGSFPAVHFFSYVAVIFFIAFRPLTQKEKNNEN
jgi:hypothetical protein